MNSKQNITILGIESSCDDTAAAVICNRKVLASLVANQEVHKKFGGVVPELASRAHQANIVPVVDEALKFAGVQKEELNAIAFARGPGLIGSLLVGASFAKAMSLALNIPLIEVNHMQAHILATFISPALPLASSPIHLVNEMEKQRNGEMENTPKFPFLCLTVSGGHTQFVLVKDYLDMKVIGETHDDAAGEAFDKAAKILGLPYPGGPLIDKFSKDGNPNKFIFPLPQIPHLDFSFSGLKTAFLYFVNDNVKRDKNFIKKNLSDICASIQFTIIKILIDKLISAAESTKIKHIAIAGGVSANSELRKQLELAGKKFKWKTYIPPMEYCTDNAAMIAIAGYFKYLKKDFAEQNTVATARYKF